MPALLSRFRSVSATVAFTFLWLAATAQAQSTFGSFTGTVSDPSGAVVPGATVTVTNTATQTARTAVTASDGT